MSNLWLLLDMNYLAHVAKYSTGHLSYGGSPTGTAFGVIRSITSLQEQFRTDKVVFCFDSRKSLRKGLYPDYKGNRHSKPLTQEEVQFEVGFRNQISRLRKTYLPMMGYRNILWASGYESDDHLAACAEYLIDQNPDNYVKIVTSDHDLFQCIRRRITVYNPKDKKDWTLGLFHKEFYIYPRQWAKVKAIAGCHTDNVKGIRGVGEVTAIHYLCNELKSHSIPLHEIRSKKGQEIITRNLPLVTLPFEGTPVPKLQQDSPSMKGFRKVCIALGYHSMMNDFNPFPMAGRRSKK